MFRFALVAAAFAVTLAGGAKNKKEMTGDGLEFTINQKDYKPTTFELFGHTLVDTQGFPDASYLPLDNRGYSEVGVYMYTF
jgi:hypothetical protein